MPKLSTITPAVIVAACVSLMGGGLAGAFFTWYVHRSSPAIVTYAITTTTTGADAVTKGLIPNLTLKVGSEEIPAVYTHVVALAVAKGEYVDAADVAITFPSALRIFGFRATPPSDVHTIACRQVTAGLVCRLSPLAVGVKYIITVAADQGRTPTVVTASRNTELVALETFAFLESRSVTARLLSKEGALLAVATVLYITLSVTFFKILRRRLSRLTFAGRLVDSTGTAIAGATVRIRVEEPALNVRSYLPVKTDREGEFIVGALKVEGLRGSVEIEHEAYAPLKTHFQSPLLFLMLKPKDKLRHEAAENPENLDGGLPERTPKDSV
jgi:hypothetical protein